MLQHVGQDGGHDVVQSPRRQTLERQRPILDSAGLRPLVRQAPEELLDGPSVPFVYRAGWIVHLLLGPGSELSVRVFLRTKFPNVLETLANIISLLGNLVGRPRRNQLEVPYLEATKTLEHVLQSA